MKRRLLVLYQLLTGLSDASTGILLIAAPALTLRLMGVHGAAGSLVWLSYVGAFVLSTGAACLYGAWLVTRAFAFRVQRLEVVWVLTAITRGTVALFVFVHVASGTLEPGWLTVALSDGALALIQVTGLAKGWLRDALA